MTSAVELFHPVIQEWFKNRFQHPTDIQEAAWPLIADGSHVLITAPTGSGKTLTAFLWAINRLVTSELSRDRTRVLYISPLKALNNDIQRNLKEPLEEITGLFEDRGETVPDIRALTRSGDTPQEDRRKMIRRPPEILITTPESLNLMLSSVSGRHMLGHLSSVIIDEIHAVVGSKRGVHLITAVDRLVRLSGEFQRISLSATVKERDAVSSFIGGFRMKGPALAPRYTPRTVEQIQSVQSKQYRIQVRYPEKGPDENPDGNRDKNRDGKNESVWDRLAKELVKIIEQNRSTLFFTNARRLCEKLTFKINRLSGRPVAYSHHGSLSRQLRHDVEQKLKNGDLKAIVATSSLEMGIDIGNLDEVVLIQSPPSVSAAVQRVGRAGHRVGRESCGTIFPAHPHDLIHSAVLAKAIDTQDIEPLLPIRAPLDVLAQILVSMTGVETWDMDELFAWVRTSLPYRHLTRQQFDLVLSMLAGKYAQTRIRELKARVSIDRLDNTVAGKKGALLALYMSGGTIPDRGYYQLRHQETHARIGELDEEYVWEAKIGQIATFGTQNWKINRITHNDVFALPVGNRVMDAPFWRADEISRDFHFSRQISGFLESANEKINGKTEQKAFLKELETDYHMDPPAAKRLVRFLARQKEATATGLPHHHHLVLEYVRSGPDGSTGSQLVLHTLWGGRLNRPYALALEAAWREAFKEKPQIFPGNDAIVIQLPQKIGPEQVLGLVTTATLEPLLRKQLEGSGFFGARFRECAGRALLVTRKKMNQRMPLWMTRLRSQKIMESVLEYEDFPILLESWRTCFRDEFDMPGLMEMMAKLDNGEITWSVAHTSRPSPFAANMAWNQINQYMYQEDQPASSSSKLGNSLVRDMVLSPDLRPAVPRQIVTEFETKRQRLVKGYAPQSFRDLVDWLKERVAIPWNEWLKLQDAIRRDDHEGREVLSDFGQQKILCMVPRESLGPLVVAVESIPDILAAWYPAVPAPVFTHLDGSPANITFPSNGKTEYRSDHIRENIDVDETGIALLSQWQQFYGPKPIGFTQQTLGIETKRLDSLFHALTESRTWISGQLIQDGQEDDICDCENFETLLRMARARAVPDFQALNLKQLSLFIARHQGLTDSLDDTDGLFQCLEKLTCLPVPAHLWESDIFPARVRPYHTAFLDTLMQEGEIRWQGYGKQRAAFYFEPDMDLLITRKHDLHPDSRAAGAPPVPEPSRFFDNESSRLDFTTLLDRTGYDASTLWNRIWEAVWQGDLSNDTFSALRKGIETHFKFSHDLKTGTGKRPRRRAGRRPGRSVGRTGFSKWRGALPPGYWFKPQIPDHPSDALEQEELNKDRARLLLDRYGILFRELLQKEIPEFKWSSVFRSLRIMELSGEILGGYFFKDIPGPQFISRQAFRKLTLPLPEDFIYWVNAADPASLCGVPVEGLKHKLPKRLASTHLVFKGPDLMMVSERSGKSLSMYCPPGDPHFNQYLAPLSHLLHRQFSPLTAITIETINREDAAKSPYAAGFETLFDMVRDFKKLVLYKKII